MKYEILNEHGEVLETILADEAFVVAHHPGLWRAVVEAAPDALVLRLLADTQMAAVGETVTITAELRLGTALAPISAMFAVPIEDAEGRVTRIKAAAFVAGAATVTLVFPASGYYRLTEAGINRKLPEGQRIRLAAPFEITICE